MEFREDLCLIPVRARLRPLLFLIGCYISRDHTPGADAKPTSTLLYIVAHFEQIVVFLFIDV